MDSQALGNNLAIFSATVDTGTLVSAMARGITRIATYPTLAEDQRSRLRDDARFLELLVEKQHGAVHSCQREEVLTLVDKIDQFLKINQRHPLYSSIKVLWSHEYQILHAECQRLKDNFVLDCLNDMHSSPGHTRQDIVDRAARFYAKTKSIENKAQDVPEPSVNPDHWTITFPEGNLRVGKSPATEFGDIELRRLEASLLSRRALQIYQDIQSGAHVQTVHGIAEIKDVKYVVLEDCSQLTILADTLQGAGLPNDLAGRVKLAYDIAQSVAWFHEGALLLKTLSDRSVALVTTVDQKVLPKLLGLEHVRHLYEQTNSARIDVRYQAPETKKIGIHTQQSDVWSLGIIVWQIITRLVPYNIPNPIDSLSKVNVDEIHKFHAQHMAPNRYCPPHSDMKPELAEIVDRCWNYDPRMRLTSKGVAERLLHALTYLDQPQEARPDPGLPLKEAQEAAFKLIINARVSKKKSEEKLDKVHVNTLLSYAHNPSHPECAFLIGAAIWWKLFAPDESMLRAAATNAKSAAGRRAEFALPYLNLATAMNYEEAFAETSDIYCTLHQEFSRRSHEKS